MHSCAIWFGEKIVKEYIFAKPNRSSVTCVTCKILILTEPHNWNVDHRFS